MTNGLWVALLLDDSGLPNPRFPKWQKGKIDQIP